MVVSGNLSVENSKLSANCSIHLSCFSDVWEGAFWAGEEGEGGCGASKAAAALSALSLSSLGGAFPGSAHHLRGDQLGVGLGGLGRPPPDAAAHHSSPVGCCALRRKLTTTVASAAVPLLGQWYRGFVRGQRESRKGRDRKYLAPSLQAFAERGRGEGGVWGVACWGQRDRAGTQTERICLSSNCPPIEKGKSVWKTTMARNCDNRQNCWD